MNACIHCRYVSTDEMKQCKSQCKASKNQCEPGHLGGSYSNLKTRRDGPDTPIHGSNAILASTVP